MTEETKIKIEGYEEITHAEAMQLPSNHYIYLEDENEEIHHYKKIQVFPIKIKTKVGYTHIKKDGTIKIFHGYNIYDENDENNIDNTILYSELEQFETIIKQARQIRDNNDK